MTRREAIRSGTEEEKFLNSMVCCRLSHLSPQFVVGVACILVLRYLLFVVSRHLLLHLLYPGLFIFGPLLCRTLLRHYVSHCWSIVFWFSLCRYRSYDCSTEKGPGLSATSLHLRPIGAGSYMSVKHTHFALAAPAIFMRLRRLSDIRREPLFGPVPEDAVRRRALHSRLSWSDVPRNPMYNSSERGEGTQLVRDRL